MRRMHNQPHPGAVLREYLGGISITVACEASAVIWACFIWASGRTIYTYNVFKERSCTRR